MQARIELISITSKSNTECMSNALLETLELGCCKSSLFSLTFAPESVKTRCVVYVFRVQLTHF